MEPPKEQPPRNLSGTPDRAGLKTTLESGFAKFAEPTEGVSRFAFAGQRSKLSGFRDRGGDVAMPDAGTADVV